MTFKKSLILNQYNLLTEQKKHKTYLLISLLNFDSGAEFQQNCANFLETQNTIVNAIYRNK